jgi:mono/diheme cytochrome c family protein
MLNIGHSALNIAHWTLDVERCALHYNATMTKRLMGLIVAAVIVVTITLAGQAPQTPPAGGRGGGQVPPPSRGGGGGGGAAGPADKPLVDFALAEKGKDVWIAECVTCHGAQGRGTDNGPNLMRSVVFLHDRYGSEIGPFLKKGHPLQSGKPPSSLTDEQITNIAHFLRKQLNDTLRGAAVFTVQDIRSGDPKAGAEFFNGAGKCTSCHSATGDLAGLAAKYETVDIQQRMLFPGGGRGGRRGGPPPKSAVRVTVTPQGGAAVSGVLVYMDDFVVTLQDENGVSRTFKRTPAVKVQKTDPLDAHHALLDTITDKNIHDLVAYLETLK